MESLDSNIYNIVIVDDHQLVSRSLKKLIETFHGFAVIGQLSNGKELIEFLNSVDTFPDLILLDVNMPIMNGKETMKWLYSNRPEVKVLILSMDDQEELIIYMLRHGARGYISKDIDPSQFKTALQKVLEKGFYHSDKVSKVLLDELKNEQKQSFNFTDNEKQFLELACTEMTYKEIAQQMYLSPKTIDGYREKLFKKIQVKSRIGLVLYAIKNKLVSI